MGGTEYVSNVENFFTDEEVTWRESMDGTAFLLTLVVVALVALVAGAVVWWRRGAS